MIEFNVSVGKSPQINSDTGGISQKYAENTYEKKENKVTSLSDESTNEQYPSAKATYDIINGLKPDMVKRVGIDGTTESGKEELMKLGFDTSGTIFQVCELTRETIPASFNEVTYYYIICVPTKRIPLMGRVTDNYYQIKLTDTQAYIRKVTKAVSVNADGETTTYEATEWETYPNKVANAVSADSASRALSDINGIPIAEAYQKITEAESTYAKKNELTSYEPKSTVTDTENASETLVKNIIFNFGERAAITITLPAAVSNDYISGFTFVSGATPTSLTMPTEIKFSGVDCFDGSFTPTANKTYQVIISRVANEFWGDVDARDYEAPTEETA